MSVSKIDLLNRKFSRALFGYSRLEVDQFLQEAAEALGQAVDSRKDVLRKLKRLEETVEEYRRRDETLRDTLMSTQKMVDDLKAQAGREAEIILDQARGKAEGMVQQGYARLTQLREEVERLKRQRAEFEVQLKGMLESHLRLLEAGQPERERLEEMESKVTFLKKAE